MESKKKRHSWDIEETRYFLELVRERKEMNNLDGKRFRTEEIFSHLEVPMVKRGYMKTSKQMQMRFKTLRMQYNQYKKSLGQSKAEDHHSQFLFYNQMEELLGDHFTTDEERIDLNGVVYEEEESLSTQRSPSPTFTRDQTPPLSALAVPSPSLSPALPTTSDVREKCQRSSSTEVKNLKRKHENRNFEYALWRLSQKPSEEQAFCNYLQCRLEKLQRKYFVRATNTILLEVMKIEAEQAEEQE